jgi:hypothetical protein
MATRMQQRRGTAAQWTAANPILAAGEIGFETDTSKFKIGNGSSNWAALQYFANAAELAAIIDGAPGILNTLDELAAAIGDDPAFFTTTANSLALKAPIANPTFTGTVGGVTKSMVGLGNVDNTSDANKPVSTATQTALDLKATVASNDLKAPLASPALTGEPTAPTADITTNTTQIATTAFVQSKVNALIDAAPEALNTLNELAAAINDDQTFAATVAASIGEKVAKAGDTMTGALTLSGAPTNGLHAATKTYVDGEITSARTYAAGYADQVELDAASTADTKIGLHNSATENVHGIANTANLATLDDLAQSVGGVTDAYSTLGGVGITWNASTEAFDIDNTVATVTNLSDHNSDTTDVHGIADTSALATKTYANDAVSAQALLTTTEIGVHNSDTTGVHGIADTSALETTTGAQAKADSAAAAAVSTHSADTTAVHGIADTSALALTATVNAALDLKAPLASPTFTGTVSGITKAMVGLDVVDNTPDNMKPVSNDTQAALDLKAPLASPTFTGTVVLPNVNAGGDILPSTDNTYSLGSPSSMWKDIYVGPGSLYVNGQKVLQDESGAIVVSADINENLGLRTSGSGNIELDPTGTGTVNIKGPLVVEAGANFSSGDGNGIAFSNGIKSDSVTSKTLDTDLSLSGNGTGKVYLNDNAEVNGNLVVGGNLTVSGTTTSVNTETISLADNIIDLNSNFTTGSPTENSGLRVMRGDSNAVQMRWNESSDKWEFTNDGTNYSVIAPTDSPTFTGTVTVAASGVAFTDGTQTKEGTPSRTPIIQKSAAYTLSALTERDSLLEVSHTGGTAVQITIPTDATLNFPIGTSIDVLQTNTGGVTIAAATPGTTAVNATPGLTLRTQWSSATLFKRAANTWVVYGDLK